MVILGLTVLECTLGEVPKYAMLLVGGLASYLAYEFVRGKGKEVENMAELSKNEATLWSAIESFPRGFLLLDTKGKVVLNNKVVSQILEREEEEWSLAKLDATFGESGNLTMAYRQCLHAKKPLDPSEFLWKKKWIKLYLAPNFLKGPGSELLGVIITIDDVTSVKAQERSKEEFFTIASHELRTPLTTIRGNADLLIQFYGEKVKDEEFGEMLSDIRDSSVRLIEIVNDFLDMGRLEQGRIEFSLKNMQVEEVIERALREYQVTGSRRNIALTWEKPEGKLPEVVADPDKVRQILVNLVGNALKFTEKGKVSVRAKVRKDEVVVYVEDTGRGILPKNQGLLFRKFQQAGDSLLTRDTTRGTGLGLYISKLLVEGMGGEIWLDSTKPHVGSTFAFSLPIKGGKK